MTKNRFRLIRPPEDGGTDQTADLNSTYAWDNYGRMTSITYTSQSNVSVTNSLTR